MKKINTVIALAALFVAGLSLNVKAAYDTNVIPPKYENGGEVYGISASASQGIVFFPDNCESIDKVTIVAKNSINGSIIVKQVNDDERNKALDTVYETCSVELKDFTKDDIESITVNVKVKKTWVDLKNLKKEQLSFFSYDTNAKKWNNDSMTVKADSTNYYNYEVSPSNFNLWAVAKSTSAVDVWGFIISNLGWVLLCCITLLILLLVAFIIMRRRQDDQSAVTVEQVQ
jgi:PGF-pre-PGF domain-containing protein